MSILKKLFAGKAVSEPENDDLIRWIPLTEEKQFHEIIGNSSQKTQAIFKHSTRCGISKSILRKFERKDNIGKIDFHYLDLLQFRNISNEIATRLKITHESPQLILIRNGVVVSHDSHYDLMKIDLSKF